MASDDYDGALLSMKPSSIIVIVVAVIAVGAAVVLSRGGGGDGGGSPSTTATSSTTAQAPTGSLKLSFVVSPEKEELLKPAVKAFNAEHQQVGGKPVLVEMQAMNSGDAEAKIAAGKLQPDVWSPASSFWGRLLNLQADKAYVGDENESIVRTPLVIATFAPMAAALGYPKKPVSFADIDRLATAPDGWGAAGKPEFGRFKYVHTNPDSSTSGASAVAASYYAAAGKKEGLTDADVAASAAKVKQLEASIVHYGDSTLFIADQLCKGGMAYASAVAMEETTLIELNRRTNCTGGKMVAIYPSGGTFFSDSPFIVLNGPWVTATDREAAAAFQTYLASTLDAETVGRYGFRPGDASERAGGYVTAANGVDPAQPARELRVPEPKVLDTILKTWRRDRKPANVLLVLDNSGSMNDEQKLEHAKEGLSAFFAQTAPQDSIGLTKFSATVVPLVAPAPFRTNAPKLRAALKDVIPEDDTAVYDATYAAVEEVSRTADTDHINAVVILTDGEDTASTRSAKQVVERLGREGDAESSGVRVFTIAYGSEPDQDVLASFAEASGGKAFVGSTDDIESVYRSISSFF
jgi:Ca-activated chloride channel family protein